jgi:hypothetical protein
MDASSRRPQNGFAMGFIADFLRRKEIDEFARSLASQVLRRLPVEHLKDQKKLQAEIEIALGHAQGFQRKAQLGTFGKSRLANTFQWALIEQGYGAEIAKDIGYRIPSRIAAPKPQR